MKTAKEYLMENLSEFPNHDEYNPKAIDAISDFMTGYAKHYHEEQVKKDLIAGVGGSFSATDVERAYDDGYGTDGEVTFDIDNYR